MNERQSVKETIAPPEKAYLVGVDWKTIPNGKYAPEDWPAAESLSELERLSSKDTHSESAGFFDKVKEFLSRSGAP